MPSVDEVTEEDGLLFRAPVDALLCGVAKLVQELPQGVSVAVDVADAIVRGCPLLEDYLCGPLASSWACPRLGVVLQPWF